MKWRGLRFVEMPHSATKRRPSFKTLYLTLKQLSGRGLRFVEMPLKLEVLHLTKTALCGRSGG